MSPKTKRPITKKSGKDKASALIDGVPVVSMTREQLEGHVIRLRDELDKEREERNYFQLERDKIQTFWDMTKQQLKGNKTEVHNLERDIEEVEEKHLNESKVYRQKILYNLHEYQRKLCDAKIENVGNLKDAQDAHKQNETTLLDNLRELKKQLRDEEKSHQNLTQSLRLKHSEDLANMKLEFQKQVAEIESKYEIKMKCLRNELEKRRKADLQELEEQKNEQINNLLKSHDKAFVDVKNYYNDVMVNNLALITTLKEQIESMKKKEEKLEKQMHEVMTENKKLREPLQKATIEVAELQKQMSKYNRVKEILSSTKIRLNSSLDEAKNLKWEQEVLEQKFKKLQQERDELHDKFLNAIQEVQQKSIFKNVLLEKKLQALEELVEKKDAKLSEVICSQNSEPNISSFMNKEFQDNVSTKDKIIKNLQLELTSIKKAYQDLLQSKGYFSGQSMEILSLNTGIRFPHV